MIKILFIDLIIFWCLNAKTSFLFKGFILFFCLTLENMANDSTYNEQFYIHYKDLRLKRVDTRDETISDILKF